jgi:amino acid transporter
MSGPSPAEFLSDPLSDVARKERRNLLIASTTAILAATMGLAPAHISALGIEFSPPAQSSFVVLVALIVVYFIAAFVLYGISDFFIWRKKYQDYLVAV